MRPFLCSALVYLLYTFSLMAEPRMLDRLILEINGKSFSQRQIEIYSALRTLVAGGGPSKALPRPDTWKGALDIFKNEMLVYSNIESDPQRMESFQPDNKALQEAEKKIQRVQLEERSVQDFFRQRRISDGEIVQQLMMMFRIQAYIRSRVQVLAPPRSEGLDLLEIDANSDWFASMQRTTSFRFFDKAKDFIELQSGRT